MAASLSVYISTLDIIIPAPKLHQPRLLHLTDILDEHLLARLQQLMENNILGLAVEQETRRVRVHRDIARDGAKGAVRLHLGRVREEGEPCFDDLSTNRGRAGIRSLDDASTASL